jgi:Spy/CpxP family protein refolding chaperone
MREGIAYRLVLIGVCAGVAAGPLLATAQQARTRQDVQSLRQRMMGQQQRWWKNESRAAKIGLSEEQIQSLDEMADRGREQIRPVRQRYAQAYRSLIDRLASDAVDDEAIAAARTELIEAWSEMTSVGVDQLIEMRTILSEEQWEMLPQVAPRAIRLGNMTLRGSGVVTPEASSGEEN